MLTQPPLTQDAATPPLARAQGVIVSALRAGATLERDAETARWYLRDPLTGTRTRARARHAVALRDMGVVWLIRTDDFRDTYDLLEHQERA